MNFQSLMFGICLLAALLAHSARADGPAFEQPVHFTHFLRGNTHTHTTWSDGDSEPADVIKRYKDLGYDFVVLTDHNHAATALHFTQFNDEHFLAVPGEEVTYSATSSHEPGHPEAAVHVNAICMVRGAGEVLPGVWSASVAEALQKAVAFSRAHGAVAQINHPNYLWSLTYDDIKGIDGPVLMEIANQHQAAQNAGDAQHPSVAKLWDRLLSDGKDVYGVASDDMHALNQGHGVKWAHPGKGWVEVAADSLSGGSISDALAKGKFYSSTGTYLSSVSVEGKTMSLEIDPRGAAPEAYVTTFIGKDGKVLATVAGLTPSYELHGGEGYVRALVQGPKGKAWTQASRVRF